MVSLKSVLKFQEGNSAMRHVWYAQYTIAGIRLNPPLNYCSKHQFVIPISMTLVESSWTRSKCSQSKCNGSVGMLSSDSKLKGFWHPSVNISSLLATMRLLWANQNWMMDWGRRIVGEFWVGHRSVWLVDQSLGTRTIFADKTNHSSA